MKRFYDYKSLLCSILLAGGVAIAPSCVNDEYDFDNKDLEMDMNIGGDFSLPLGSTLPTYLEDLLDPDEIEYLEELDGEYKISMSDNISISIDELSGSDIVIDGVSPDIAPINIAFTKPKIPAFDISVPDQTIDISPAIDAVDLGAETALDQSVGGSFKLGSFNIPSIGGIEVPETEFVMSMGGTSFNLNFSDGIKCPNQVISLYDIEIGSTITAVLDVSSLGDRFEQEDFMYKLGYIQFTFPEGFIIDGGSNIVRKENLVNEGNFLSFEFEVTGYNKRTYNQYGSLIPAIGGDIICDISDTFTLAGTTKANNVTSLDFTIALKTEKDSPLAIKDVMLEVANIEVLVEDTIISEPINIELPESVEKVKSITLEPSARTLYISVSPIELPSGLTPTGDNLQIKLPAPLFTLYNSVSPVGGYNVVELSMADMLSGVAINEEVEIYQLILDNEPIVDNTLSIDPGIKICGTTIMMAGDISYTDFNEFITRDDLQITTSVSASPVAGVEKMLEVEDAELVVSNNAFMAEIEPIENEIAPKPVVIPKELERIDSLNFKHSVMAPINIAVALDGIDATLKFKDYKIEFPKFIRFKDPAANGIDKDNVLTLNDEFVVKKDNSPFTDDYGVHTFNKELYIEALEFSSYDPAELIQTNNNGDKVLVINESVKISGDILLDGGSSGTIVTLEDLPDEITADVNFAIGEMAVKELYGLVCPALESQAQEIDLSALTEMFDGELTATLAEPSITFTASNSLSIPIVIDRLDLTPYKGNEALNGAKLADGEKIIIAAAEQDGVPTKTTIVITSSDNTPDTADVSYVKIEGLTTLLNSLPDKVIFDYNATAYDDGEHNHMIDLTQSGYEFSIDYALDIPLAFEEFSLDYTTEMKFEDFGESLSMMTDYVSGVELELKGTNTLPIEITIAEITPIDANGNVLSSIPAIIDSEANTLVAGGTSTIKARLSDKNGELKKLGGLRISISAEASSTVGGAALTTSQYFKFEITAHIHDGVNISLEGDNNEF